MKCLIRECGKERLEYKIVALDSTSKILQSMDLDYFKSLYEMLIPFIRKAFDDKAEENDQGQSYFFKIFIITIYLLTKLSKNEPLIPIYIS